MSALQSAKFQKYVKSIRLRPTSSKCRNDTWFQKYVKSIRLRPYKSKSYLSSWVSEVC